MSDTTMKKFVSKALEVNLAVTRSRIEIPPEYQWFLALSHSHFGIHKRAEELINEYHHPYSNPELVIDLLRRIALDDLWFYLALPEHDKPLELLLAIFRSLLQRSLPDQQQERAFQTLLEFADLLHRQKKTPDKIMDSAMAMLRDTFTVNHYVMVRSSGFLKERMKHVAEDSRYRETALEMLRRALQENIIFWEKSSSIESWLTNKKSLFHSDMTSRINHVGKPFFAELQKQLTQASTWEELQLVADFSVIANRFRSCMDEEEPALDRIYYLFYLLSLPGMTQLKDHLLWDLNRMLRIIKSACTEKELMTFLERIFHLFQAQKDGHLGTLLDCILTLGKEVIELGNPVVIHGFIDRLISFGFVPGNVYGINQDWQVCIDKNHIKNIRVWMDLIECRPEKMLKLLSALIVNLRVQGIFISDTDLFQRDITKLLNSDVAPIFKMIKQLARIFPVYYNEIGAEGELRDITTKMDEVSFRQDRLIHFLRKQVHTESNNTHIELTKRIIRFWHNGDIGALEDFVPQDVFLTLRNSGEWFDPVHEIVTSLCEKFGISPEELLEREDLNLAKHLKGHPIRDQTRFKGLIDLYRLLKSKYTLDYHNIIPVMNQLHLFPAEEIEDLRKQLDENNTEAALRRVYYFMEQLREVILNPEKTEACEDIYHKRHIAAGIPSMYGKYHEVKFEAMGLTFRLERLATALMTKLIGQMNMNYITAKSLRRIARIIELFRHGMMLDGITNQGFDANLKMFQYSLTSASFTLDQFVNIFQFMAQNIREIIYEYFLRNFDMPLRCVALQQAGHGKIAGPDEQQEIHRISEKFYREVLSSAFLVQPLDNFISDVLNTLRTMVGSLTPEVLHNIMSFDSDLIISPIYRSTPEMDNQIFLGAKAYFLKQLFANDFPIPPGFVLTTELFRHRKAILQNPELTAEIEELVRQKICELEEITGKKLGVPENPLLFSVRSGTAISMPGAMDTYLNVGMNDKIAEGLSRNPHMGWTAWDCYRRFLQGWGMAHGIPRDEFDRRMSHFKHLYQVARKVQFTDNQIREIALSYKALLKEHRVHLEQDPFRQIIQAILSTMDSWYTDRAKTYRRHLQIAEEWGTAVMVQEMVLGNLGADSGTGVFFTRDPMEEKPGVNLYGDFTLFSQGEDVVSGLVHTLPISEKQRKNTPGNLKISLEKDFPEVYQELRHLAKLLVESYGFNHQEIEFTFESPRKEDLYILQTRDYTTSQPEKLCVFATEQNSMQFLGSGIGIGGGAMNGIIVFDRDDLKEAAAKFPGSKKILVRPDTVPDDIDMIFDCDGLLTARGGATSHAAVTAARLGKICIVNCKVLQVVETDKKCFINGVELGLGDKIGIDGRLGNIYQGNYPLEYTESY
ncbi:MAG: pyruvate phosphate dikinase [Deltaproteobacteria bacterium]|nr:pyruvate phosphate dikinase [Deltaproteobacteria bacterium]TLN03715.1 MAG: pyruvate phosphate dikinase [bacterium]